LPTVAQDMAAIELCDAAQQRQLLRIGLLDRLGQGLLGRLQVAGAGGDAGGVVSHALKAHSQLMGLHGAAQISGHLQQGAPVGQRREVPTVEVVGLRLVFDPLDAFARDLQLPSSQMEVPFEQSGGAGAIEVVGLQQDLPSPAGQSRGARDFALGTTGLGLFIEFDPDVSLRHVLPLS